MGPHVSQSPSVVGAVSEDPTASFISLVEEQTNCSGPDETGQAPLAPILVLLTCKKTMAKELGLLLT